MKPARRSFLEDTCLALYSNMSTRIAEALACCDSVQLHIHGDLACTKPWDNTARRLNETSKPREAHAMNSVVHCRHSWPGGWHLVTLVAWPLQGRPSSRKLVVLRYRTGGFTLLRRGRSTCWRRTRTRELAAAWRHGSSALLSSGPRGRGSEGLRGIVAPAAGANLVSEH